MKRVHCTTALLHQPESDEAPGNYVASWPKVKTRVARERPPAEYRIQQNTTRLLVFVPLLLVFVPLLLVFVPLGRSNKSEGKIFSTIVGGEDKLVDSLSG